MQVENIYVDDIDADPARGWASVRTTLYEFGERRWVSAHRGREGRNVGPMTLLDEFRSQSKLLNQISIRQFPERQLRTESGRHLAVSFRDRWTAPPWTIYALVLPKGFVATETRIVPPEHGGLQLGASKEGRIFYHITFLQDTLFDIEARIEEDPSRYDEILTSADAVEGRKRYGALRRAVKQQVTSSDFWFKLLELGGKLLGGS